MGRIVVGTDGSEGSVRALRWALEEAGFRDAELEIVHSYVDVPLTAYPMLVAMPSDDELRVAAQEVIDKVLAEVGGPGDVPVRTTVAAGGAAGVLCDRARDADLLVVGARGLGGFRGLLLGSVSQQVVAHSPCPVVTIVPERRS